MYPNFHIDDEELIELVKYELDYLLDKYKFLLDPEDFIPEKEPEEYIKLTELMIDI